MKIIKLLSALMLIESALQAQASMGFNMAAPPMWGPAEFTVARYYYLPAVEAYYDLDFAMFIYSSHGKWVKKKHLPLRFRKYDLFKGYKVVMYDYLGDSPYNDFSYHKKKYSRTYRGVPQQTNGEPPVKRSIKLKVATLDS